MNNNQSYQWLDEALALIEAVKHYPGAHSMKIVGKSKARQAIVSKIEEAITTLGDVILTTDIVKTSRVLGDEVPGDFIVKVRNQLRKEILDKIREGK